MLACPTPPEEVTVDVPSVVEPSRNVTVPVGFVAPPSVMVALKVTAWPGAEG
jgi:hypothetical protein